MTYRAIALLTFLDALAPPVAAADAVGEESSGWNAVIVGGLALSLALYGVGTMRLWRRAGWGRGIRPWQAGAFIAGWAAIAIALVSPIERLSDEMFAAHMIEHELLMVVAAPLLVVARSLSAIVWALPIAWRRAVGGVAQSRPFAHAWNAMLWPGPAWTVHAAALWLWHAPVLFQAALIAPGVHALQHTCFFGAALFYWWSLLRPGARWHRGISILSLFGTSVHSSFLGALLTLSQVAWYPLYGREGLPLGLSPLEDQQLAGLIMWVPGGLVYVGAALGLLYAVLSAGEARSAQGGVRAARA